MMRSFVASFVAGVCLTILASAAFAAGPGGGDDGGGGGDDGGGGGGGGSPTDWVPYGYQVPGDPVYGFNSLNPTKFPLPTETDFLGLAAKGNVVLGDYKSTTLPEGTNGCTGFGCAGFQEKVVEDLLDKHGQMSSHLRPYVVDPSDEAIGYLNDPMADCNGQLPCFNANYNANDGGQKKDGTDRKFYESSLSDAEWQALMLNAKSDKLYNTGGGGALDAAIFTNHMFMGLAKPSSFNINGSMVARDDGLIFNAILGLFHDIRLLDKTASLTLPASIKRPTLTRWEECPASGCPEL